MFVHEFMSVHLCDHGIHRHNNTYVLIYVQQCAVLQDNVVQYPRSAARSGSRKEGTLPHDTRGCTETHPGQHPSGWEQRQP